MPSIDQHSIYNNIPNPAKAGYGRAEYDISTSIGYGNSLSNTAYSFKLINTAYPLPLDTEYRSSGTEADSKFSIIDFRAKFFLSFFGTNPTDCLSLVSDQLMLRVFPLSLSGAASRWLRNEPIGSIKTWEDLKTKFLNKYCPPGRTAKKMEEISNFRQEPD
ncbi:hypothetical protein Tco_0311998 [Tanacetum coccineum]